MAAEITITIKCGNCRHSVPRPNRLLPECKMGRVQGTLCDRWIPFRKSIHHKIWMADNPASNTKLESTAARRGPSVDCKRPLGPAGGNDR